MMRNISVYGLIALLSTFVGIYFHYQKLDTERPRSEAASRLFSQTLSDTNSKPHKISQWKGKLLLVNFWATWCAPCIQEMPELSALQSEKLSKNLQIIGIGIDSSANISEFEKKYKLNYPLYVADINAISLSRAFGNQTGGLPFTVLIGPDGRVKKTYLGRLKMNDLRKDIASF